MKAIIFFMSIFIFVTTLSAQEITGDWKGKLNVSGMKLRLVFHISKTDAGFLTTMDSPDQGAKGIVMTSTKVENNSITIEHTVAKIIYSATLNNSDSITGIFKQGGLSFPLNLSRNEIIAVKPNRPQEPKLPYVYNSEEITFTNYKDSIILSGTFTFPKKAGKYPAVILISGSGPQNRNEEIMGHKPFLILSDFLTRNGIAVLRFDDRGTFKSKGHFSKAITNDFVTDVDAAVNFLLTRKEVNKKKIGLVGHSEGGIIAPIVASNRKDIKFIVIMAGSGITGKEILLLQQELIGRANGMSEVEINETKAINKVVFDFVNKISNTDSLRTTLESYTRLKLLEKSENQNIEKINDVVQQQVNQITSPWMLHFIRYDPAPMLTKVKCAVLAINGSKDLQVPSEINLTAINNALIKGKNKKFVTKEIIGLNHLFQECSTGSPNEYSQIEQTIAPIALETMLLWIKKQ